MACVSSDPGGLKRVLFVDSWGKRRAIRLGKCSVKNAESIAVRVEQLAAAKTFGSMGRDLCSWVTELEPLLRTKLEKVDLLTKEVVKPATLLDTFIVTFLDGRADLKPSTMLIRNQVKALLTVHFGRDRDVATITAGDADDWQQWLIKRGMAPATIAKRVQVARSYFRAMQRRELIVRNPFDGIRTSACANSERMHFVTIEDTQAVLAKCPDHHWRLIVALARFGGLRTPSETLSLRWQEIDWDQNRFVVTSPKTEHHEGGQRRVVPLFPELRPFLDESLELAPDGDVFVVDARYRKAAMGSGGWANANLRTTFHKIIKRAGLTPWPKVFQNLRSSRETELAERFPIHVVTKWLGNSPKVALKHYLQTTEEHFAKALEAAQNPAHSLSKAAQNPAQQLARSGSQGNMETPGNTGENTVFTGNYVPLAIAETGLEPVTPGL